MFFFYEINERRWEEEVVCFFFPFFYKNKNDICLIFFNEKLDSL